MRVLIYGLPGSGKTFLAKRLFTLLKGHKACAWFDADQVRKDYDDWDFSDEGRMRQVERMKYLCTLAEGEHKIAIASFVAPTQFIRDVFGADIEIWLDTVAFSASVNSEDPATGSTWEETDEMFEGDHSSTWVVNHKDYEDEWMQARMAALLIKQRMQKEEFKEFYNYLEKAHEDFNR
jgi:AAA+ ATPase superfamily predicted ATPase